MCVCVLDKMCLLVPFGYFISLSLVKSLLNIDKRDDKLLWSQSCVQWPQSRAYPELQSTLR